MAQIQDLFDSCSEYGCDQSRSCVSVKKWRHQEHYIAQFCFITLDDPPVNGTVSATGTTVQSTLETLLETLEEKLIKDP